MWRAEIGEQRTAFWRTSGTTLGLREFGSVLYDGMLHQFLVCDEKTSEVAGVVATYAYDPLAGHLKVGLCAYTQPALRSFAGLALLIEFAFHTLPLRKVYFEVVGGAVRRFGRLMNEIGLLEGTIDDFEFSLGVWLPLEIWSTSREQWYDSSNRVRPRQAHLGG